MQATTLGDIFTHPSFITILTTILIVITNIMIGVSMLPADTRRKRYPMHRCVYVAVLVSFGFFLWVTHRTLENSVFNYPSPLVSSVRSPRTSEARRNVAAMAAHEGVITASSTAGRSFFARTSGRDR